MPTIHTDSTPDRDTPRQLGAALVVELLQAWRERRRRGAELQAQSDVASSEGTGPYGGSLRRLLEAFAGWRLRRRQRAELYALSDRMLKDIGVSRWEIDSIVNSPDRDAFGRVR